MIRFAFSTDATIPFYLFVLFVESIPNEIELKDASCICRFYS